MTVSGADDLTIRPLGAPGDLGWIVLAHGETYVEEFGWNSAMEALICRIVADYAERPEDHRQAGWIAELGRRRVGCILCVADQDDPTAAKLRLLLVHSEARGQGLGGRLVDTCVEFARVTGYDKLRLWTNHPLVAARAVYLSRGFRLIAEEPHHSFGVDLIGQTYELDLARSPLSERGSAYPRAARQAARQAP